MSNNLSSSEFNDLMEQLAKGWSTQDTDLALDCFHPQAIYMEPPDGQLYVGHDQLRPFFAALQPGTYLTLHHLTFSAADQVGMVEFTFGMQDQPTADVGVVVVELEAGRIKRWREYLRQGSADFETFASHEGKDFKWHIGNYP